MGNASGTARTLIHNPTLLALPNHLPFPTLTHSGLLPKSIVVVSQLGLLGLLNLALVLLGDSVDETSDETSADGGDGSKVDWVAKEDHTRGSDGKLVERSNHSVSEKSRGY